MYSIHAAQASRRSGRSTPADGRPTNRRLAMAAAGGEARRGSLFHRRWRGRASPTLTCRHVHPRIPIDMPFRRPTAQSYRRDGRESDQSRRHLYRDELRHRSASDVSTIHVRRSSDAATQAPASLTIFPMRSHRTARSTGKAAASTA